MSLIIESDGSIFVRACRICLESNCSEFVTLNEEDGWLKLFEYCFGVSIAPEDEPRILCVPCADKIKSFTEFKSLCHNSDKLWRSLTNSKFYGDNIIKKLKESKHGLLDKDKNDINKSNAIDNESVASFNDNIDEISLDNAEISQNTFTETVNADKTDSVLPSKSRNEHSVIKRLRRKATSCGAFTCDRCLRTYASNKWFQRHLKACNIKNQGKSSGIGKDSQDISNIPSTGSDNFSQLCGICKFSTNNVEDIYKHLTEHWTNNDLQCAFCEFIGKDQAAIAAHRYTHYANKTKMFVCHICQKKTRAQLTLQFHYRKVHLNKIGGLCSQPNCDKTYNCWRLWKDHERWHKHPGYICDFCGQKYRHKHLIIEHVRNHINPSKHICDVCGKTFLRMRNLKGHIENMHTKSDPIKCSHCSRTFKNLTYLRVHERRVAMEKSLKCEICSLSFPTQSLLTTHRTSHSDERPHCCHICGSRYKRKGQLVIHIRSHTGDRPYKCVLCTRAFPTTTQLRSHVMVHTGILPYKCSHCEMMFRCKKRLLKHTAVRHKMP